MSWNKGFTKETHPSVRQTSETMKKRKINNFKKWQTEHAIDYAVLEYDGNLAEYIGVVLGDGHIERFPRTERITIVGDSRKPDFITHYAKLTEILFNKIPKVKKIKGVNALKIDFYQKHISKRLGIPTGNRKNFLYQLPAWIENNDECLIRFLRGLFEAEASLSIHLPTCTYNFAFSNMNPHLLKIVGNALRKLEFHPEVRHNAIRIRRKAEVERLKNLIHFRQY